MQVRMVFGTLPIPPDVYSYLQADAWTFNMIQNQASNLFRGKILVGHSLWNDLAGNNLP